MKKPYKFRKNLKSNYIKVLKQVKKRIVKHTVQDKVRDNQVEEDLPLTLHSDEPREQNY